MTTARALIDETKRHLHSGQREALNKLGATVSASDTTLTFSYDTGAVQAGAYLQLGLEVVYVWTVDAGSKSALVERAQQGSIATGHTVGTVITVNPKFPDFAILKALNDDLADLSSPLNGLYAVRTVQLTASTNSSGYDLVGATNVLEILDVRMRHAGQPREWTPVTNFELSRDVSTSDFPSGFALSLAEGTRAGQPIRVLYKAGFGRLVNLTDSVEIVAGMPVEMQDIPPLGASMRLVAPREIKRNFTEAQGEPRRASEVPPGSVLQSLRGIAGARQNRIISEAARLAQRWPDRGFMPVGVSDGW